MAEPWHYWHNETAMPSRWEIGPDPVGKAVATCASREAAVDLISNPVLMDRPAIEVPCPPAATAVAQAENAARAQNPIVDLMPGHDLRRPVVSADAELRAAARNLDAVEAEVNAAVPATEGPPRDFPDAGLSPIPAPDPPPASTPGAGALDLPVDPPKPATPPVAGPVLPENPSTKAMASSFPHLISGPAGARRANPPTAIPTGSNSARVRVRPKTARPGAAPNPHSRFRRP